MSNVFIIHGAYGNSQENWFPWLKKELQKRSHQVYVPNFPTPKNQSLEAWLSVWREYENLVNEKSIFIGHSLGVAFILNLLEESNTRVKSAILVSGFVELLNNPDFDAINKTFTEKLFKWEKIKSTCQNFYVFHSDNDPYVPLQYGQKISNRLAGNFFKISNAGHFNKNSGYITFPQILQYID